MDCVREKRKEALNDRKRQKDYNVGGRGVFTISVPNTSETLKNIRQLNITLQLGH